LPFHVPRATITSIRSEPRGVLRVRRFDNGKKKTDFSFAARARIIRFLVARIVVLYYLVARDRLHGSESAEALSSQTATNDNEKCSRAGRRHYLAVCNYGYGSGRSDLLRELGLGPRGFRQLFD